MAEIVQPQDSFDPSTVVSSLNGLTGDISLTSNDSTIIITPSFPVIDLAVNQASPFSWTADHQWTNKSDIFNPRNEFILEPSGSLNFLVKSNTEDLTPTGISFFDTASAASVTLIAPGIITGATPYTLYLPVAQGGAGEALINVDGAGQLGWSPFPTGTVSSFTFTDGNGFDGTVTNSTTTPTLSLTTSLTAGSVPFIATAGALSQDNTNFTWDDTAKSLHVGAADTMLVHGVTVNSQFQANSDTLAVYEAHTHSNTVAAGSAYYGARSRGTTASPLIVATNDLVRIDSAVAYDGTDYEQLGYTAWYVGGTPGSNDMPGKYVIAVTPDGGFAPVEAVNFASTGVATFAQTISGSITGNAGTATILATSRTLWGQSFDGSANVTGSLTAVGDITGGASSMSIQAGTGASRTLTLKTTTSGSVAQTNLTLNADQSSTFSGDVALGANNLTMTGSLAATGARVTKGWFTDLESTNMPTVGGTAILTSLTAPQFTTIELGAASDTTLSRVSAGVIAVEGSTVALASNKLSFFSATTSAELAGVISDETGSGALVFGTAPTLSNPVVGTQTFGDNSTKAASTAYVDGSFKSATKSGDQTTAAGTDTTITGITFATAAGETWSFEVYIIGQVSGAGGARFTTVYSNAPSSSQVQTQANTTGIGAQSDQITIATTPAQTATMWSAATTEFATRISGSFTNGASANTVTFKVQPVNGAQTVTIRSNSYLVARRSN